jgi:hypothetical protein
VVVSPPIFWSGHKQSFMDSLQLKMQKLSQQINIAESTDKY